MYNTINKRTLQALNNRFFKKDIAQMFNVSPGTIARWSKSKKPIKTIKNYSETIPKIRKKELKAKPAKSNSQKFKNSFKYVEGKYTGKKEFYGKKKFDKFKDKSTTEQYYYEFSSFNQSAIRYKIAEIIEGNINHDQPRTALFLQLYCEIKNSTLTEKGETYKDHVSTGIWACHHKDRESGKHLILHKNIEALFTEGKRIEFQNYEIQRILGVTLVEKTFMQQV